MEHSLSSALELHRGGKLAAAAQAYHSLLARDPRCADALHLLGALHHQQGQHAQAIELMCSAVALRPNDAVFHANLGEAYRAAGDFDRAVGCCRTALQLAPEYPEALCNLGAALRGLGRTAEAIDCLRRALALRPDSAVAHNNLGIALRDSNEQEEALAHFRRAVECGPEFAPARSNLGQLLLQCGEAAEALAHCQAAVRLQSNVAELHHNLGNVHRTLEQFVEARSAYLDALRLNPNLALAQAHMGLILQREAQLDDALAWLKRAVDLEPDNATFWQYLAELHGDLEDTAQAIPCWRRVLGSHPDHVAAHLALGWALQEEGDLAAAAEHYQTAARLEPAHAGAQLSLGGMHEELGDLAAAETAFREALRLQPGFALPHGRLATLLRANLPDDDLTAIEARLADVQLPPGPRARLLFGLAHVLDARKDYAGAADCLRQANAMTLEAKTDRRGYQTDEHERFIDGLLTVFDPAFFSRVAALGSDTQRPVFVFGLPRSGTTLIEQVLASHSQIHGAGELRLARQAFESLPAVLDRSSSPRDCVAALDARAIATLAQRNLARMAELAGGQTPRIVDKMPDNYMYLGLLAALFPRATFIHCRRDLRDIAVSCWMTDFRSIRWANDSQHIAHRFVQYQRLMDHWRSVLPVPIHEVHYEHSVDDLESVARRLIAACGLAWEPACLEFYKTQRPVRTASVVQVRQPVYKRSLARWKNYEPDLGELFTALAPRSGAESTNGTIAGAAPASSLALAERHVSFSQQTSSAAAE